MARLGTGSVAAWADQLDSVIKARAFTTAGVATPTITVSTAGTLRTTPDVAGSADGQAFVVVWQELNATLDVKARIFDETGAQIAAEFVVNVTTSDVQADPSVEWLNNGQFVVVWHDQQPNVGDADGGSIKARLFTGSGAAITGEFQVNSTTLDSQLRPQVAALPNGGFVVVWHDRAPVEPDPGNSLRLQAFDAAGGKIGGEILVNTTTTSSQDNPEISVLADGRVVVTWDDFSSGNTDVRMQIIDPRDGLVTGTSVNDTLYGHDQINDEISGFGGNDLLRGLKGDDALYGGEGIDTLRGGFGADDLDGGSGTDFADYSDSTAAVTVNLTTGGGSGGFATGDTFVDVEGLVGSNFADVLIGNALSNPISGGGGADVMRGLAGHDVYTVDNAGDVVDESVAGSSGFDTVQSSITFSLSDTVHAKGTIEHVTLIGTAAINASGSAGANQLIGNLVVNTLNGLGGADYMRGMGGSDTYVVDHAGDVADESVVGSTGNDLVRSSVTVNLSDPAHFKGLIEHVTLIGSAAVHATGNDLGNTLIGNGAANFLTGRAGSDALTGGAGFDHFLFDTALGATNIDTIRDFDVDGAGADSFDTIRLENAIFTQLTTLGDLSASRFLRVTNAADFDNGRTITYVSSTGGLWYDTNGAAAGGATLIAALIPGLAMTAADFFVT